jgi:lysophospholipase L1-like esterase
VRSWGTTALAAGAILVLLTVAAPTGSARARPPLLVVAIGDSISYGRYYCNGCSTFVRSFAHALGRSTSRRVRLQNLSRPVEVDSEGLRDELESNPAVRAVVARASALIVTVGHDEKPWVSSTDSCDGAARYPAIDWSVYDAECLGENVDAYEANLGAILGVVRDLRHGKRTLIRVMIDYNDLLGRRDLPHAGAEITQGLAQDYAFATCEAAVRFRADCIDVLHAFNGLSGFRPADRFLAHDHTHPNARGHQVIARLLIRAGFGPIARRR